MVRLYGPGTHLDRKSTRLNSSHSSISYAVFCLKKKNVHGPQKRLKNCRKNLDTPRKRGSFFLFSPFGLVSSAAFPCFHTQLSSIIFFFFNDTATTEIYTLSLHDALPISEMSPTRRNGSGTRVCSRSETC